MDDIIMEGVCAKCLQCKGFEGFEKWCPECESEQPQPFRDHPIKKGVRCCKKCASDATHGLWLCTGFGCSEQVAGGKLRLKSCWSKANRIRGMKRRQGNKPDAFCLDCTSPPCSSEQCTTCRICRNPSCRLKHCNSEPKPLNALGITAACKKGYSKFLCLGCEGLACSRCGIEMSKIQKQRKRAKQDKSSEERWYCTDCQKKKYLVNRK